MPTEEIEITKYFQDKYRNRITITAGPRGWTVVYVDNSTAYKDEDIGTEANFNNAYNAATDVCGQLYPIKEDNYEED
jgi:hypothetical protein